MCVCVCVCEEWGVLNLDIFSLKMRSWILVCVICNSKCFHSLIFKLCIMTVLALRMCSPFYVNLIDKFLFLGLINLDIFSIRHA